jgi:hypothetical protein
MKMKNRIKKELTYITIWSKLIRYMILWVKIMIIKWINLSKNSNKIFKMSQKTYNQTIHRKIMKNN